MRCTQTRLFGPSVTWLPAILVLSFAATLQGADYLPRNDPKRLQVFVEDLARQLALPATVRVTIVESNALLVSVAPQEGRENAFVLSFEDSFLDGLDDEELCAVIAHELGHVWIFTHHPYLQTERLANSIAMRIVSRANLEKVYGKVWQRGGTKGDLVQFLGQ
jgi:Zn-dependent protease with chaperone function